MKIKILILCALSLLLLLGASPWEGAAAVAPEGELPLEGMFVATNAFPVNTVVDITNIETNRSTRVIVAKGIDSPGLLAVVSREAAELIGMRSGSVSRLRMVQPADPIAYLRFIEGQASGIPVFDSGNVLTEETVRTTINNASTPPPVETPPAVSAREHSGVTGPSYVLEPEWRNRTEDIVTIPGYNDPVIEEPVIIAAEEEVLEELVTAEETEYLAETDVFEYDDLYYDDFDDYIEDEYIVEEIEEIEEPEYIAEESFEESFEEEIIEDDPWDEDWYIVEEPFYEEDLAEELEEEIEEYIAEEEPIEDELFEEEPEYIVEEPFEEEYEEELFEDESEYIAEELIEEPALEEEVEYVLVPTEERPPELIYGIDPNDIIPALPEVVTPVVPEEPVRPPVTDSSFSVPRVSSLNRGSYYVQLAALDSPELVEAALRDIDRSYNPVIFNEGDRWYRILLGPMNQGESAAVLARFRSIGYRDAFVRHAR